jgi:hypothetical protein
LVIGLDQVHGKVRHNCVAVDISLCLKPRVKFRRLTCKGRNDLEPAFKLWLDLSE